MVQNGKPLGQMLITLGLDTSAFTNTLTGAKRATRSAVQEMANGFKIMDSGGKKVEALNFKSQALTKVITAQTNELGHLKEAYEKTLDKQGNATSKTADAAKKYNEASAKLASYQAELKNTVGSLAELQIKTTGFTGNVNAFSEKLQNAGSKMQTFGSGIQTVGGHIEGVGSKLTKGITMPIVGATTAFATSLVKIGLDVRTFRAQAQIYYEGLYQDADKAKQQLDDLMTFAKTTPFAYESIVEADMVMQTFGMSTDRAKVTLEAVANAIAATGGSSADLERIATIFGQIESSGKLSLQDMNQLVSAKIPAFKIVANELGMSVMDLRSQITAGEITSDQAITALTKGLMQGTDGMNGATQAYTGALEKVKQSLPGAIDSMKSAWKNLALETVDENVFEKVITSINKVTSMLNSGAFNPTIKAASKVLGDMVDGVGNLAEGFAKLEPKTQQNILKFIAYAAAAGPIVSVTGKLTSSVGGLVVGAGKLTSGIGSLGKGFVNLSANMAKKSAINELTKAFADGSLSAGDFANTLTSSSGPILKFGSAAGTAAGSGGLGAMSAALGPLGPAILGIVGVGGALAVGYGAWKLFGEEAWNSSQRIGRWGSDVGETVDKALTDIQSSTGKASGEFALLEQGISGNADNIAGNFAKMGQSIEDNLTNKISTLKEMVNKLPDDVKAAADKLTEDEIKNQEKYLQVVQENNKKISEIRKTASDNNRQISYDESLLIKAYAQESATAYVESLGKSEKETKQILESMTGNVEQASKEQAKTWLQNLGKQRQDSKIEYGKMQDDLKSKLVDAGYDLNSEYAKEMLKLLETSGQSANQITEDQMALILGKYPELANEIFLANGQMIDSTTEASSEMIEQNKKMMETMGDFSRQAAENAEKNREKAKMVLDDTSAFADFWNGMILDPKTGTVKTNAQEEVNKAAQSEAGWNQLMWISKDANVSTNVKMMIAEAAIANGKWENMSFTEQQALLDSNVTQTMTQALQAKGTWSNLTFDQKKAVIYSNTPEVMAETMLNLGLWQDYQLEIKELKAENMQFLSILGESEGKLTHWQNLPDYVKEILGDNYDLLAKIYESEETFNRFQALPDSQKQILANNEDLLLKILSSEESWNQWANLPDAEKNISGNNQDLLDKVFASTETYNAWCELPANVKAMLGDNVDVLTKVQDGTISIDTYNKTVLPALKRLLGDSANVQGAVSNATGSINNYNQNINPKSKTLIGHDEASGPATNAFNAFHNFMQNIPETVTKTARVVYAPDFIGPIPKAEKGTNFHSGGPLVVNDQAGPLYKELVIPKDGPAFIPEGRNVLLNLKRGAKVMRASLTKQLIPHYASGVGIPENSDLVRNLRNVTNQNDQVATNVNGMVTVDNRGLEKKVDEMIKIMSKFGSDLKNLKVVVNQKVMGEAVTDYQDKNTVRSKILASGRVG